MYIHFSSYKNYLLIENAYCLIVVEHYGVRHVRVIYSVLVDRYDICVIICGLVGTSIFLFRIKHSCLLKKGDSMI